MSRDYTGITKNGPGVPKNAPRKKGFARLAEIMGRDFGSIFLSGLAAFAAMLPAALAVSLGLIYENMWLTLLGGIIGGAIAAPFMLTLTDMLLRTLQDDPTPWRARFASTLKTRFKPTAVCGVIAGAVLSLLLFIGRMMLNAVQLGSLPAFPVWVMLLFDFAAVLVFTQGILPQLCLGISGKLLLKNSLFLFLRHPAQSIAAAAIRLLWYGLMLALFPTSVIFAPFIGFWPPVLLSVFILFPCLEDEFEITQYEIPPASEADGITHAQRTEIWWRRHWGFVLAGIGVLCCLFGIAQTFLTLSTPDLQIAVVGDAELPDAVISALQTSFEPYATDVNGDGKITVQINNYAVSLDGTAQNADVQMAGSTLLVTDLSAGDSSVWLVEHPDAFVERYGDKVDADSAVLWSECPALCALDAGTYSTELDIENDKQGQSLLQDYTVFALKDNTAAFDKLIE